VIARDPVIGKAKPYTDDTDDTDFSLIDQENSLTAKGAKGAKEETQVNPCHGFMRGNVDLWDYL